MRSHLILALLLPVSVFFPSRSDGQEDKPEIWYVTVIRLMDGNRVSGTLTGNTDTSLILSEAMEGQADGEVTAVEYHYTRISKVIIKEKPVPYGKAIAVTVGCSTLTAAAYAAEDYILHSEEDDYFNGLTPEEYVGYAALIGAAVGLVAGPIMGSAMCRERFIIKGDRNEFSKFNETFRHVVAAAADNN